MSLVTPKFDLDAVRESLGADVALLLSAVSDDRFRVLASAGAPEDLPDEVVAPQGSLLARIVAGVHTGRVTRLPLMSGTSARSRPLGPSLVLPLDHADAGTVVLVLSRSQASRAFREEDLDRARGMASAFAQPSAGPSAPDLHALVGDATFRAAFEGAAVGMSLVDPSLRYRWVNDPLCEMLGRDRDDLLGLHVTETVHPDHLGRISTFYERLRRGHDRTMRDRLRFQRPGGAVVWADVGGSVVTSAPRSELYLVQQFDVTEEQGRAEEFAHRAMHDELTGLTNRALLRDRLQALLARGLRGGSRAVVFYLDLDHFKEVNDTFGHVAGDAVLKEMSRRLVGVVRAGDTVARFGGDEFVVAGEATGASEAAQIAKRVGDALRPPIDIGGGRRIAVTASIGIALSGPLDTPDDVIARADVALLEAKRSRTLHVVADDPP